MDALIAEFADGLLHSGFVPVNWTLIIGGQEPSGEESVCAHVPRDGQAFYVTLGLVQYTKARLDGHAQEGTRRDE